MAVIEVKHVTKDYGYGRGIFDVSFEVKEGEAFGFLGPNGAGKSTTIRHLMGFSKADEGELSINGKDSWKSAANIKQDVGYLPGELAFPKGMTGDQFIEFMANERQITDMTRTEQLKELFKVETSKEIKEMSLGTKRKLAVVTAFMHNPKILILDEPTSGLDPVMQERFIQFILKEKSEGKTILLSSHIFTEVDATCDRIAIIKDGVVVSTVETKEMKKSKKKEFIKMYGKTLLGIVAGMVGGDVYWRYVDCTTGTYPITSARVNSTIWGEEMGGLLLSSFMPEHRKIKKEE